MNEQPSISQPIKAGVTAVGQSQVQYVEEHDMAPIFDIAHTYPMVSIKNDNKLPPEVCKNSLGRAH